MAPRPTGILTALGLGFMMPYMRTTVTLDPDVLAMLQEEMKRQNRPFKQVLNQAVRRGLMSDGGTDRREPFRTQPHAFGFKAGVDLDKLNQLAEEMDSAKHSSSDYTL